MKHQIECLGEEACICPEVKRAYERGLGMAIKIMKLAMDGREPMWEVYEAIVAIRDQSAVMSDARND